MTHDQLIREKNDTLFEVEELKRQPHRAHNLIYATALHAASLEIRVAMATEGGPKGQIANVVSAYSLLHDAITAAAVLRTPGAVTISDPPAENDRFAENLAAISAEFHSSEEFKGFYKQHGENMGGFPAIWNWMKDLAKAFTVEEDKFLLKHEWDGEWIDTIFEFVALVHEESKSNTLNDASLAVLASRAFQSITVDDVKIRKESGATSFSKVPGKPIKPIPTKKICVRALPHDRIRRTRSA